MSDFIQRHREQESPELPEEAKGEKEVEKDQGPEAEEPQLKQKTTQVRRGRLVGWGWARTLVLCLGTPWGMGLGCQLSQGSLNLVFFLSLTSLPPGFSLLHG